MSFGDDGNSLNDEANVFIREWTTGNSDAMQLQKVKIDALEKDIRHVKFKTKHFHI